MLEWKAIYWKSSNGSNLREPASEWKPSKGRKSVKFIRLTDKSFCFCQGYSSRTLLLWTKCKLDRDLVDVVSICCYQKILWQSYKFPSEALGRKGCSGPSGAACRLYYCCKCTKLHLVVCFLLFLFKVMDYFYQVDVITTRIQNHSYFLRLPR